MTPTQVLAALTTLFHNLRKQALEKQLPLFLTVAQLGRVRHSPSDPTMLGAYLSSLPADSPLPSIEVPDGVLQITSKTIRWHRLPEPSTSTPVDPVPTVDAPEVAPATPQPPAPPTLHPRLMSYFAVLRHRLEGSGVPFRLSLDDLGKVPHRLRGSGFPLKVGILEMPAHYQPVITMINRGRGFVPGNLTWDANGYV